ncbi:hypothetical protein V6N13_120167 [Hibiscus sabdariffa]
MCQLMEASVSVVYKLALVEINSQKEERKKKQTLCSRYYKSCEHVTNRVEDTWEKNVEGGFGLIGRCRGPDREDDGHVSFLTEEGEGGFEIRDC